MLGSNKKGQSEGSERNMRKTMGGKKLCRNLRKESNQGVDCIKNGKTQTKRQLSNVKKTEGVGKETLQTLERKNW